MEGIEEKIVVAPAPIVSRAFQELANGMVKYHDAVKVKTIPFPKGFQQVCDILLWVQWMFTPILAALWCNSPGLTAGFTFLNVFVLWSLALVAKSIENPFASRQFIHEAVTMQKEMNLILNMLLQRNVVTGPVVNLTPEGVACEKVKSVPITDFWQVFGSDGPTQPPRRLSLGLRKSKQQEGAPTMLDSSHAAKSGRSLEESGAAHFSEPDLPLSAAAVVVNAPYDDPRDEAGRRRWAVDDSTAAQPQSSSSLPATSSARC